MSASSRDEAASGILRRTFGFDHREEHDEAQLSTRYAEFADDERRLAEEGIQDYERGLGMFDDR